MFRFKQIYQLDFLLQSAKLCKIVSYYTPSHCELGQYVATGWQFAYQEDGVRSLVTVRFCVYERQFYILFVDCPSHPERCSLTNFTPLLFLNVPLPFITSQSNTIHALTSSSPLISLVPYPSITLRLFLMSYGKKKHSQQPSRGNIRPSKPHGLLL